MSEKKIIRTALDPTPAAVRTDKSREYDWKKDPSAVRKMELARPALDALYKKYSHLGNLNEEISEESK